jgi:phosphoribosylanthranilate isomerase
MLPRVKVCGIRAPADLRVALDGGVDAIGVLLGQVHPSTDFISPALARDLLGLVPPFISTVLVTHEDRLEEVLALASSVPTSCIQLHSDLSPAELAAAREQLRPRFVIGKVTVEDSSSIQRARDIALSVHAILLDSANRATGQVGGADSASQSLSRDSCRWPEAGQCSGRDCHRPACRGGRQFRGGRRRRNEGSRSGSCICRCRQIRREQSFDTLLFPPLTWNETDIQSSCIKRSDAPLIAAAALPCC